MLLSSYYQHIITFENFKLLLHNNYKITVNTFFAYKTVYKCVLLKAINRSLYGSNRYFMIDN